MRDGQLDAARALLAEIEPGTTPPQAPEAGSDPTLRILGAIVAAVLIAVAVATVISRASG